jgi:threonine synthase
VLAAADADLVDADDRVAVLVTGSGLKDVASAMNAVAAVGTEPLRVPPNLAALDAALNERGIS